MGADNQSMGRRSMYLSRDLSARITCRFKIWIVFQASKRYLSVARLMKQYEDKKFETWREQVETHLLSYLKRNLLTRSFAGSATTRSVVHTAKDDHLGEDDYRSPLQSKLHLCYLLTSMFGLRAVPSNLKKNFFNNFLTCADNNAKRIFTFLKVSWNPPAKCKLGSGVWLNT